MELFTVVPSFANTIRPTPFQLYDSELSFQTEADNMVTWVKRRCGDDVLSIELTSKMVWASLEEATQEATRLIHEFRLRSELVNALGLPTGSDYTNRYPRQTLEFLLRLAEPYGSTIGVGGSFDATLGYFDLEQDKQDYNLYSELKSAASGSNVYQSLPSGSRGKLRVLDVFHFDPLPGAHYLLNSSNLQSYLANTFNYESYANSAVFYVLPIYEDVLRRGMLEAAFRVRRSNYSYQLTGGNLRIYPIPIAQRLDNGPKRLYVRVFAGQQNPFDSNAFDDDSVFGISGPNNMAYGTIPYATMNQPMKAWVRQFCLAICLEILGRIRSKMRTIPIPGNDLTLDGPELLQQAAAMKEQLIADFKELLGALTVEKLLETQANQAEFLNRSLRFIPIRAAITIK